MLRVQVGYSFRGVLCFSSHISLAFWTGSHHSFSIFPEASSTTIFHLFSPPITIPYCSAGKFENQEEHKYSEFSILALLSLCPYLNNGSAPFVIVMISSNMSIMARPWISHCKKFIFECVMKIGCPICDDHIWSF
jgi:hypothetical protein